MIEVVNLSKEINKKKILKNINLSLDSGKIYGFVGRNGSGKSMLFKSIAGFIVPTSGNIMFDSIDIYMNGLFAIDTRVLIDKPNFFPDLTGKENLEMLVNLNNLISKKDIEECLDRFNFKKEASIKVGKYSLGMKQKLGIIQAIMENPKVLILDEPFNSLDEDNVDLIRKILIEEKSKNKIILLASHIEEDIKLLADEIFNIENGEIVKTSYYDK